MTIKVTIKHDDPHMKECLMAAEVFAGSGAPTAKGAWTVIRPGEEATFYLHKLGGHLYLKEADPDIL